MGCPSDLATTFCRSSSFVSSGVGMRARVLRFRDLISWTACTVSAVALGGGGISCAPAAYEVTSGVEISYFASTSETILPDGLDYAVVCAQSQSAIFDPHASHRVIREGQLEPVTRVISDEAIEVWGASLTLESGECGVWITERNTRPDCSGGWPFTIRPRIVEELRLGPLCGDRLCAPRGGVDLHVQAPGFESIIDLDATLNYTIACEGSVDFQDERCHETRTLEGSVEMNGGWHMPVIGPIGDGRWEIPIPELPSGSCTFAATVEAPYNEARSCTSDEIFVVATDETVDVEILLACGDGSP